MTVCDKNEPCQTYYEAVKTLEALSKDKKEDARCLRYPLTFLYGGKDADDSCLEEL